MFGLFGTAVFFSDEDVERMDTSQGQGRWQEQADRHRCSCHQAGGRPEEDVAPSRDGSGAPPGPRQPVAFERPVACERGMRCAERRRAQLGSVCSIVLPNTPTLSAQRTQPRGAERPNGVGATRVGRGREGSPSSGRQKIEAPSPERICAFSRRRRWHHFGGRRV